MTLEEERLDEGLCIRCGRENGEGVDGEDEQMWHANDTVCPKCSTHDERRDCDLAFIGRAANALAAGLQRRDHDPEPYLESVGVAFRLARQRGVSNTWHHEHPLDPIAGDGEPWDAFLTTYNSKWSSVMTGSGFDTCGPVLRAIPAYQTAPRGEGPASRLVADRVLRARAPQLRPRGETRPVRPRSRRCLVAVGR